MKLLFISDNNLITKRFIINDYHNILKIYLIIVLSV
jgi:hypothetical protein